MFKNLKLISIYQVLLVLILIQSFHKVNGYTTKVEVKSKTYNLNENINIKFNKDRTNVKCVETNVKLTGQDNSFIQELSLKCDDEDLGYVTLPKKIKYFDDTIKTYKLNWVYNGSVNIESSTFWIDNNVVSKDKSETEVKAPSLKPSDNINSNLSQNEKIEENKAISQDDKENNKEIETPQNTDIVKSNNSTIIINPPLPTNNNTTTNVNTNNSKNNEKNEKNTSGAFDGIHKIMFTIIICLIGGIMIVTVKLIKIKTENNMRKVENSRMQNEHNINEIKFPPLRMNPLESESFLNINNSAYDILESSKYTSIYVPSEESIEPIENSNVTVNFPINDKSSDVNNCKSIFSSPA